MAGTSNQKIDLRNLGFRECFRVAIEGDAGEPARVVRDGRDLWHIVSERGEFVAALSGKFRRQAKARGDQPAVGDWVLAETKGDDDRALIHRVLPRQTAIVRKVPGDTVETQVVAANVDIVFIVNALDGGRNFNLRRIERYLALVRESGAAPVLVLNKCDLCADPESSAAELRALAPTVPVLITSAISGRGITDLRELLASGATCALLGPSGVGKSAIVNQLLGEEVKETGEVRARDRRGRHTTTYRELLRLACGALVIDTPGLREIQLWGGEENLADVFPDVTEIAQQCRFADCRHEKEPACAVRLAVAEGRLPARRLDNFLQLRGELEELAERRQRHLQRVERRHRRVLQRGVDKDDAPRKRDWE
ncbi:MAG: ribosome small subunit-dependent GTPase A [Kiritimatiellae bacterium]|nr:ribosome small subunit-dependent GTPase A [Kiritimatiellia bacterium]